MNRAPRAAWPALTIVVAAAALTLVLAPTGDDGSAALLTGRPFAVLAGELAVAATLGLVATAALEVDAARRGRLLDVAAVAACTWTAVSALTAFLLYLAAAPSVADPSFGPGLVTFLLELDVGRVRLLAVVGAALLSAVVVVVRSRRGAAGAGVLALVVLVPVALTSTASGDSLAVARTAVSADWLRLAGIGLAIGVVAVHAAAAGGPDHRVTLLSAGGTAVAAVGALSTALLRRDTVQSGVVALDAVVLAAATLVAAVAAIDPHARRAAPLLRLQLLVLAAAAGVGAAPAVTDPVRAAVAARTTAAEVLTGEPLPAPIGAGTLLTTLRLDPILLLVCAGLLAVGVAAIVRWRRDAVRVPPVRAGAWAAGVLLLLWLTCGGPAVYGVVLVPAFLAQHVALLLVVPLLLVWAASPWIPPRRRVDARIAAALAALVLVVLAGTGVLRWSIVDPVGTAVATLGCLAAGVLLASAFLDPAARVRAVVVGAVVLLAVETAGALGLALGPGLLEADWFGAMGWGTDALAAQRSGAVLAWLIAVPATVLLLAAGVSGRRSRAVRGVLVRAAVDA